jgi:hypothetical protein
MSIATSRSSRHTVQAPISRLDNIISGGTIAPGIGTTPVGGTLGTLYNGIAAIPAAAGRSIATARLVVQKRSSLTTSSR